jgi:hypothetical protein
MRCRLVTSVFMAVLLISAANAQSGERDYVYCDNGIRCVRAPCPSRSARDVQTGETLRGIRLDLSNLPEQERKRSDLQDALYHGTLVLSGHKTTMQIPEGGTVPAISVSRIARTSTKEERAHCSSAR